MEIDVVGGGQPQASAASAAVPEVSPLELGEKMSEEERSGGKAAFSDRQQENLAEDEEDVCRICRTPGDDDSPLYYPCACSGSIKYVHQDCLLQWLNHSHARQCEVCKHAFAFSPVYADNAPSRLPFQELLLGMAVKAARGMRFFVRLMFVLSVWLLFIPFTTFWIWRFTFVRSFSEAHRLFVSRFTPGLLLTDCLHGFLLSAGIVFIFLGATSLREYFRHLRELGGQDGDRPEEVVDRGRQGRQGGREVHAAADRVGAADLQEPLVQVPAGVNGDLGPGQGLAAGAGQLFRRNAENVAARLELQAARLEAHVEQMFDAVEDPDGAEDVPFDELVGMQGPVFHLIENAITVLASNAIFLALVALVPFTLGRLVLSVASRLVYVTIAASGMMASNVTSLSMENVPLGNTSSMLPGRNVFFEDGANTAAAAGASALSEVTSGQNARVMRNAVTEAMVAALRLSDAATVAVGYGVILLALSLYLGLIALIRYSRGEPITVGRIHGVTTMAEAAPSVARQVMAGVVYMATMVKVAFLLVIELGFFPLICGWWLDICTLGMLDVSIAQRVEFFWASPLTSSLLHWFVGIVYMLQISIFVSLLREVLRPGVLYFLRDPTDPNYNPFRDLIDDPIHKHARRVLVSVVVYGSLIVMLVFLPVRVAILTAPSMFPLDIRVSDPFTEIPADMLLFHICIPFAVEHFRPRATVKAALFHWFSVVGWALGLCEFLLPGPEETNANNREQERVHRGHERQQANGHPVRNPMQARDDQRYSSMRSFREEPVDDDGDEDENTEEYKFVLRIVLLLVGAWITLLAFNSALVLVPVSLGRGIFALFSQLPIARGAKCNDLYAFNIGCYMLWATAAAVRYVVDYLRTHDVHVLLMQVLKWSAIVAKSFVLLALWIVVIPIVVGLLFELLVVVPLRVPIEESPVFVFYQDWALGLVFLKIWTRLVMLGQITPLADESWRIKFEQVRADGFANLRGFWVLREIIAPILIKLLTALCIPYVVARWIFPSFGYSPIVNAAVYRFAWLGCLGMAVMWYGVKRLRQWLLDLHNSIRDDRYLVGRRLHNFGERKRVPTSPKGDGFPVTPRFPVSTIDDIPLLGGPEDQDTPSAVSGATSAGSSGSSSVVLEDKGKFTQVESRDVLLRAAIQEGERIGMAGASLRFRHSTAAPSSSTEQ